MCLIHLQHSYKLNIPEMLANTRTLLFLIVATLFVVDVAQGQVRNENQYKAFGKELWN